MRESDFYRYRNEYKYKYKQNLEKCINSVPEIKEEINKDISFIPDDSSTGLKDALGENTLLNLSAILEAVSQIEEQVKTLNDSLSTKATELDLKEFEEYRRRTYGDASNN